MPDAWNLLDEGLLDDPAAAVARDEALLGDLAAGGPPLLRLWRTGRCLVVPAAWSRRPGYDRAACAAAALGWPPVLRGSGGGPVPLDPGMLNVSLLIRRSVGSPAEADYRLLLRLLRAGVAAFPLALGEGAVEGAFCDGRFNLTCGGRKLAGTAQRRRPAGAAVAVLAQGALQLDCDLTGGCAAVNAFMALVGGGAVRADRHVTLAEAIGGRVRQAPLMDLLDATRQAMLEMEAGE